MPLSADTLPDTLNESAQHEEAPAFPRVPMITVPSLEDCYALLTDLGAQLDRIETGLGELLELRDRINTQVPLAVDKFQSNPIVGPAMRILRKIVPELP